MTIELWQWLATCPAGTMLRVHPSMMAEMEELGFHVHVQCEHAVDAAEKLIEVPLSDLAASGVTVRTLGGRPLMVSNEVAYNAIEVCSSMAVPLIVIELKRGV